jgi:ribosomal protein S1
MTGANIGISTPEIKPKLNGGFVMPRKNKNLENTGENRNEAKNVAAQTETTDIKTAPAFFYELNLRELDKDLPPEQQKEWTAIYASFRSRTPLTGTVMGTEMYELKVQNTGENQPEVQKVLCLIIIQHRIKVIIPYTEIWYSPEESFSEAALLGMVGAKVDYVIVNVDRLGNCALGSRKAAMEFKRRLFLSDRRGHVEGDIINCHAISVGPVRLTVECNGFDFELRQRDISYTPMEDLRKEYKVGQEFKCVIKKYDPARGIRDISIKEAYPHPFDGAESRHPRDSKRQAVVSSVYAGGLNCRMADNTNVMCSYMPGRFDEEFFIGDTVVIKIGRYDNTKKQIYGTITGRQ